jgi:sucrose phosphorylase
MWAAGLAPPSPQTAFFNFLASHDGVGVVPATGILSVDEVAELCARVERHGGRVSYKNNPDGTRSPYELNCTWFDALSDPAANEPQAQAIDRFVASQAIMLSLQGVPGVYVHSLFGSPNNQAGLAETGRNRTLNREKWQRAELDARLANPARREGEVLRRMLQLIRTRRGEAAFDPAVSQRVLNLGPSLFALERTPEGGSRVICLHSVAAQPTSVSVTAKPGEAFVDLLSGKGFAANATGDLELTLAPYAVRWLCSHGVPPLSA